MSTKTLKWVPIIDEERCTGCNRCVEACGPKSLEVRNGVAVLARPDTCGSEEHCIKPCPEAAIRMAWVQQRGIGRAVGGKSGEADMDEDPSSAFGTFSPSDGEKGCGRLTVWARLGGEEI